MKKAICQASIVLVLVLVTSFIMPLFVDRKTELTREYQHETNKEADPSIGPTSVGEDGIIDKSFKSHLPLVVIDFKGNEVPNIYTWNEDGTARVYREGYDENSDPYVNMHMEIIDNDNNVNSLNDKAAFINDGKIKLRGMTSRGFLKRQYGIKLMKDGEELEESILGLDADEDYVLSNSILDLSGIRNYLTMNIGGEIVEYTPDVRFCEVIFKDGDSYTYQGLYLMMEKIKKGKGHIEMEDYSEKDSKLNYAVCRDRYNYTTKTLSTYASDNKLCYGYFTMVYPKAKNISDKGIEAIENELSTIEKCIYSDDYDEFLQYSRYLDVDSFINYFIVNEFFMNYDAGNNSTYYYKNQNDRLAIGPLWDYDNAIDNYSADVANPEYMVFVKQPWFEKLIRDPLFQKKLIARYKELRKTYLNTEFIENFIDETYEYLGNASLRDSSRWMKVYNERHLLEVLENNEKILVDRNRYSVSGEITRIKDIINIHGEYMDNNIQKDLENLKSEEIESARTKDRSWIVVAGIIAFFCMIVLVNRKIRGEYR